MLNFARSVPKVPTTRRESSDHVGTTVIVDSSPPYVRLRDRVKDPTARVTGPWKKWRADGGDVTCIVRADDDPPRPGGNEWRVIEKRKKSRVGSRLLVSPPPRSRPVSIRWRFEISECRTRLYNEWVIINYTMLSDSPCLIQNITVFIFPLNVRLLFEQHFPPPFSGIQSGPRQGFAVPNYFVFCHPCFFAYQLFLKLMRKKGLLLTWFVRYSAWGPKCSLGPITPLLCPNYRFSGGPSTLLNSTFKSPLPIFLTLRRDKRSTVLHVLRKHNVLFFRSDVCFLHFYVLEMTTENRADNIGWYTSTGKTESEYLLVADL